jgi:hypothetical protein
LKSIEIFMFIISNMTSIREMREFEAFVLRTHGLKIYWVGKNRVTLTRTGQIVMECDVRKANSRTKLIVRGEHDESGGTNRRFVQLLRFHITANDPNKVARALDAYSNREGECKRHRCFQYMRDAFPDEWALFTGERVTSSHSAFTVQSSPPPITVPQPIIVNSNTNNGNEGGDRIAGAIEKLVGMLVEPSGNSVSSAREIKGRRMSKRLSNYSEKCLEDQLDKFHAGIQTIIDEAAMESHTTRKTC